MDILEKVRRWVKTFPRWEEGNLLYMDYTDGVPGNAGLHPGGLEVVLAKADVLGGMRLHCRYHFALYRVGNTQGDGADAQWLLDFQNWVLEQSARGLAPKFGDEPQSERIYAEKAALKEASTPGSPIYMVKLTAQFIRKF